MWLKKPFWNFENFSFKIILIIFADFWQTSTREGCVFAFITYA
nr:MAG TPA: hypothetical protein [Caudoviricetes sp.]